MASPRVTNDSLFRRSIKTVMQVIVLITTHAKTVSKIRLETPTPHWASSRRAKQYLTGVYTDPFSIPRVLEFTTNASLLAAVPNRLLQLSLQPSFPGGTGPVVLLLWSDNTPVLKGE